MSKGRATAQGEIFAREIHILLPLAMMVQGDSTSACSLGYEPNVLAPNSSPIIRGDIVWKWESHIMAFDACSNHYPVI